ncbi:MULTISPECIES: amidoligase family protein [unclassified Salinivibrio]|uniref:amidoligase family protein n=1 Tax=unclassified Salinivibrio TaxID=2636825 RepID=UPI0009843E64|nr:MULTISPECIES: amidoligase family protein [unclassified Salinivibrio]OOF13475.1 alpha-L-fucosidase [Salinivibrio sp. PR919]OOF18016.1 alpha-L-fucosidase [Salinivibrio sp. PR932]
MKTHTSRLTQPPREHNAQGEARRVGVELELSGMELDEIARIVADKWSLTVEKGGRYDRHLTGDDAGDWVVELDYAKLKRLGQSDRSEKTLANKLDQSAEDVLAWAAKLVVPVEIVTPPLPLDRLDSVEDLIASLRQQGAEGTEDSPVYAFGMQLNPELPDLSAKTICAHLKAFLCLYDWLLKRADIDLSRRLTNYVDPFPKAYIERVLAADYWPDLNTLIDDYLADNPTRNRALDMLPLFAHLDPERVNAAVNDGLTKARPTFHYRLPDSKVSQQNWGIHEAWNDWVEVEKLAADPARLDACCKAYLGYLNDPLARIVNNWAEKVHNLWINPSSQ